MSIFRVFVLYGGHLYIAGFIAFRRVMNHQSTGLNSAMKGLNSRFLQRKLFVNELRIVFYKEYCPVYPDKSVALQRDKFSKLMPYGQKIEPAILPVRTNLFTSNWPVSDIRSSLGLFS